MNVLWITWKDHLHPEAGGAEVVAREITKRLVADGHQVTMLTCGYKGAQRTNTLNGVRIIRVGTNRYAHPFQALAYYVRHLRNRFDILIEEVNAAPYFSVLFERKARKFLLYHQMEGPVWLYETKPPLSYVGRYVLEPVATWLLARSRTPAITISESTAGDLLKHGFRKTHIISEGIEIEPLPDIAGVQKFEKPTLLSLGAMRAMKRTLHHIQAFEIAKDAVPELQLKVAGSSSSEYGQQVLERIKKSRYARDIEYLGKVSIEDKMRLMQKSHLIMQTAAHEGWGLTVTEAASQGTPAVVYDVHGLRDSVRHGKTGMIARQSPSALAEHIVQVLEDPKLYSAMRHAAWEWSKRVTFTQSYADFKKVVGGRI